MATFGPRDGKALATLAFVFRHPNVKQTCRLAISPQQTADLTLPLLLVRKFLEFLEPSREADQALLNSLLETIVHRLLFLMTVLAAAKNERLITF